jgi:hypothetical protein
MLFSFFDQYKNRPLRRAQRTVKKYRGTTSVVGCLCQPLLCAVTGCPSYPTACGFGTKLANCIQKRLVSASHHPAVLCALQRFLLVFGQRLLLLLIIISLEIIFVKYFVIIPSGFVIFLLDKCSTFPYNIVSDEIWPSSRPRGRKETEYGNESC